LPRAFDGDFDGVLRVEAEDEEPRMEYRRTKTGERRRTATGGWLAEARPLLGVGATLRVVCVVCGSPERFLHSASLRSE
jgi:hypothetical protein